MAAIAAWQNDSTSNKCVLCDSSFSLFYRRHHCRACGRVVCNDCSKHRIKTNTTVIKSRSNNQPTNEPVRVCDQCIVNHSKIEADACHLLYHSRSICIRCTFQSGKGFVLRPSIVFTIPNKQSINRSNNQANDQAKIQSFYETVNHIRARSSSLRLKPSLDRLIEQSNNNQSVSQQLSKLSINKHIKQPVDGDECDQSIYLAINCPDHPNEPPVLTTSSLKHYLYLHSFDRLTIPKINQRSRDIEDLARLYTSSSTGQSNHQTIKQATSHPNSQTITQSINQSDILNLPLILELTIYENDEFVDDRYIDQQLEIMFNQSKRRSTNRRLSHQSINQPVDQGFVLKLNGGLIERKADIVTLNEKIRGVITRTSNQSSNQSNIQPKNQSINQSFVPIIVDLTFERLIDLSTLPDSCLLSSRVMPCVRYYLSINQSSECLVDLKRLIDAIRSIDDCSIMLILSIDQPADQSSNQPIDRLIELMDWIMKQLCIRICVLTRERSPQTLLEEMPSNNQSSSQSNNRSNFPSTDVFDLYRLIDQTTKSRIKPRDFIPFKSVNLITQLIDRLIGLPSFSINSSPHCLTLCPIINTSTLKGVPLNHLFDLHQLVGLLDPIVQNILTGEQSINQSINGMRTVSSIEACIQRCLIGNIDVPPIFSYLQSNDPIKQSKLKSFGRGLQFFMVHNQMDIASVDLMRRCDCDVVQPAPIGQTEERPHVAMCTRCV